MGQGCVFCKDVAVIVFVFVILVLSGCECRDSYVEPDFLVPIEYQTCHYFDGDSIGIDVNFPFKFGSSTVQFVDVFLDGWISFSNDTVFDQYHCFPCEECKSIHPFYVENYISETGVVRDICSGVLDENSKYEIANLINLNYYDQQKYKNISENVLRVDSGKVITWHDTVSQEKFDSKPSHKHPIQIILVSLSDSSSFVILQYPSIPLEHINNDLFVCANVMMGNEYNQYMDFFEPFSRSEPTRNNSILYRESNVGIPGIFIFRTDRTYLSWFELEYDCPVGLDYRLFYDKNCSSCNGLIFPHPEVCSGSGVCVENRCICNSHYSGQRCERENTICFRDVHDDYPCSGKGTCSEKNICECYEGYYGDFCEIELCFGILANESHVCNERGSCIEVDVCNCTDGYEGSNCEFPICYGASFIEEPRRFYCSGNGECIEKDTCLCFEGWSGDECNIPTCNGTERGHPTVCSMRGYCTAPENCVCHEGYVGKYCEDIVQCFGVSLGNSSICSGFGECIARDVCRCNSGYYGENCEISSCFGYYSNETNVCSGRGICIEMDKCQCIENDSIGFWNGNLICSSCSIGYTGRNCLDIACNNITTCNGNGFCGENDTCICHQSESYGYWSGINCEKCSENYFGQNCDSHCIDSYCNSKGYCSRSGECQCIRSNLHGHFQGKNCTECSDSWMGERCKTKIPTYLLFSNRGDRLVGELYLEMLENDTFSECSTIFSPSTTRALGINPRCWWPRRLLSKHGEGYGYFEVVFGVNAELIPGDTLMLIINSVSFTRSISEIIQFNITAIPPLAPEKPIARLRTTSIVGSCDGIELDASLSSSSDGRALTYFYRAIEGQDLDNLNNFLFSQKQKMRLHIPMNLLSGGYKYVFGLVVENFLHEMSEEVFSETRVSQVPVPTIVIRGPPVHSIIRSSFLKLEAVITVSPCLLDRNLTITWKQISGPLVKFTTNSRFIYFPAFTFPISDQETECSFEVSINANFNHLISNSAAVKVRVRPQDLVPQIFGGERRTVFLGTPLIMDGSISFDPDQIKEIEETYEWTCFNEFYELCPFHGLLESLNASIITIPSSFLEEGVYNFTLRFSKGSRTSQIAQIVLVSPTNPFNVYITTRLPQKLNRNQRLALEGHVLFHNESLSNMIMYEWTVQNSMGPVEFDDTALLTPTNQKYLAIRSGVLKIGEIYTFKLSIYFDAKDLHDRVSMGFAASKTVTVNEDPMPGVFHVNPSEGVSLDTYFFLSCNQWIDEDTPLRYSFGYLANDGNFSVLVPFSLSNHATIQLPVGDEKRGYGLVLVARVSDSLGAFTDAYQQVRVFYPPIRENTTKILEFLEKRLNTVRDSSTEGDLEKASITTGSIAKILNSLPVSGAFNQSIACSGHGIVVNGNCICNHGYAGKRCNIIQRDLVAKQSLRHLLVHSLSQTLAIFKKNDFLYEDMLHQQLTVISIVTQDPNELLPSTEIDSLNLMTSFMESVNQNSTSDHIAVIASTIVFHVKRISFPSIFFPSPSELDRNVTDEHSKDLSRLVRESIHKIILYNLQGKVPGEKATELPYKWVSLKAAKYIPSFLSNTIVTIPKQDPLILSPSVKLPPNFVTDVQKQLVNQNRDFQLKNVRDVDVYATNYAGDIYFWANNVSSISSSIISFKLKIPGQGHQELRVHNLSNPISILIPGKFENASYFQSIIDGKDCLRGEMLMPVCKYWDENVKGWRGDGCKLSNITADYVICLCNHLTDFSSILEYMTPEMNVLVPNDFLLWTQLNHDNLTTLITMIVLVILYAVFMIIGYTVDVASLKRRDQGPTQDSKSETGQVRKLLEDIRSEHLAIGIIFRPLTSFSRPQKITILFLSLLTTLMVNAVFSRHEQQSNWVRTIVAAIIANMISIAPCSTFVFLFGLVASRYAPMHKDTPNSNDIESSDSIELHTEFNWLIHWKSDDLSLLNDSDDEYDEFTDTLSYRLSGQDSHGNSTENSNKESGKNRDSTEEPSESDMPFGEDIISEIEERLKVRKEKAAKSPQHSFSKLLDLLDSAADNLQIQLLRSKKLLFAGLIISLCVIIAIPIGVSIVMELLFSFLWEPYYTTLMVSAVVLMLVIGNMYLYFSQKWYIWNRYRKWNYAVFSLFIAAILSVLFVLVCIIILIIAISLRIWNDFESEAIQLGITAATLIILSACCVLWIYLHLRRPAIKEQMENNDNNANDALHKKPLPWWCLFFIYPFAWLVIGVMCFFLVTYGLKFGPEAEREWLWRNFLAIGQDMLLFQPFQIILKSILMIFILRTIQFTIIRMWQGNIACKRCETLSCIKLSSTKRKIAY